MRYENPAERFKGAHYCEVHSLFGVYDRSWRFGSVERIASDMASIYKEPNLNRILGYNLTFVIHSSQPSTFKLQEDGTTLRIDSVNHRLERTR